VPHIQEISADGKKILLKECLKSEMHQSVMSSCGTEVCSDARCACDGSRSFSFRQSDLAMIAARDGLKICVRGHSSILALMDQLDHGGRTLRHHRQRHATDRPRQPYFPPHVHIGIPDREVAIAAFMNQARELSPHLYALSVNSPFWLGQKHRPKGVPPDDLRAASAHGYSRSVRKLVRV
jgi:carboxylate-amine ligase